METETKTDTKPAWWFWVLAALALVWNGIGVFQFVMFTTQRDAVMAQMPAAEQALVAAAPGWYWIAFGIAVFAALLGCLALLIRKMWACPLFLVSILAVIAQDIYTFFMTDTVQVLGARVAFFDGLILVIAILLFLFARYCRARKWIG